MKQFYYVYIITNIMLNKQYVGSRICYAKNIYDDIYWGSSKYLDIDYEMFGKENFTKEILKDDYKNACDMLDGESENMHKYNTFAPNGYNRYDPGKNKGFHMAGYKHSEITKQKRNKKLKGQKRSEETKQKMRKPKSEETKQHMKDNHCDCSGNKNSMFEKTHTKEAKKKISENSKLLVGDKNGMFGKTHTKESKETMRIVQLGNRNHMFGKHLSIEHRNKIIESNKTRIISNETKQKISNTQKLHKKYKECIYCKKIFDLSNYTRWHDDNCKMKLVI